MVCEQVYIHVPNSRERLKVYQISVKVCLRFCLLWNIV